MEAEHRHTRAGVRAATLHSRVFELCGHISERVTGLHRVTLVPAGSLRKLSKTIRSFSIRVWKRKGCLLPTTEVEHVVEVLASAVRRAAETRGINTGKEASVTRKEKEVRVHIGKKDMLVLCMCSENPREYIALLIEPIKGEGAGPPPPAQAPPSPQEAAAPRLPQGLRPQDPSRMP